MTPCSNTTQTMEGPGDLPTRSVSAFTVITLLTVLYSTVITGHGLYKVHPVHHGYSYREVALTLHAAV